jgi:predicted dehydrogenase
MNVGPARAGEPLQVGVAGLGNQGRNHLRNLLARDDAIVAAVADPVPDAVARARDMTGPGVPGFLDPVEMLQAVPLDAVVVAVPTTRHFQVGMAALQRGVSVLVEKPIAATIVEAQELVRAAAQAGVTLQVGHVERFNPVVRALAERLESGDLSRIHSIKTIRGGPLPERIRDVGVAIDLATHDIDVMIHLVGERPVRVAAESSRQVHTSHEDLLYGLLHFPSGIIGLIDANWLTPEKQRRIVVLGNEGMFQADYLTQSLTFVRGTAELAPEYHGGYAATFAGETVSIPVETAEPLRLEQDAFLAAVRQGAPGAVSGADGLAALSIAKLLLTAADEGRSLPVPPREAAA